MRYYLGSLLISALLSTSIAAAQRVEFSLINTGNSAGSLEAMVVSTGSWFTKRKLIHAAILVKHPKGDLLWDTGMGQKVEEQMSVLGPLDSALFAVENVRPVKSQFETNNYLANNIKAIIPSHLHWDHVSGLEDFLGIPVWVQEQELNYARQGKPPAFLASQFDDPKIDWQFIELLESPFLDFSHSKDIFGDGSAVLLDLSGHTAGHLGLFIKANDGKEYLFVGDVAWAFKGIQDNASRPAFVDWISKVDRNFSRNQAVIGRLHSLSKKLPELMIVPAHDEKVAATLPQFPHFSRSP